MTIETTPPGGAAAADGMPVGLRAGRALTAAEAAEAVAAGAVAVVLVARDPDVLQRALGAAPVAAPGGTLALPGGVVVEGLAFADALPCDPAGRADAPRVRIAVVGAHLSGQPLNHQLTDRGGRLVAATRTSSGYRLYRLPGTVPAKPGLVRAPGADAVAIEVEVWELGEAEFGSFVAEVPPPLAIGTVRLQDGDEVAGFVCEPCALEGARDISHHGGWRAFLAAGG